MDNVLVLFCLLFVYFEYTTFIVTGILFVFIVIADPIISQVPMSSGVSVTLCPIGVSFATLICISCGFIVFGFMVITPRYRDWETTFYRDWETDRKSTRLNSSHSAKSRMPSSA